ncbi:MAG: tetratricopeptide repeat-containing sensor histidine kinase [Cyclobacteriaceae bacterium]
MDSVYYELFKENRVSNLPLATSYAVKSLEVAKKLKRKEWEVKACYALGYCYRTSDKLDSSIYFYKAGIKTAREIKLNERLIYLTNDLATVYERMDMYDSALYFYSQSRDISNALGDIKSEAIAFNNIGLINYRIDNISSAIDDFKKSINLASKIPDYDKDRINICRTNLALALIKQHDYESAKNTYLEILVDCGNCASLAAAEATYGLGIVDYESGNRTRSYTYFKNALERFEVLGDKIMIANSLYKLGSLYLEENDMGNAYTYLTLAEEKAVEGNVKRVLRDVYDSWSVYYERIDELRQSLLYKDKYIAMKDSIFNEGMSSNIRSIMLSDQRKQTDAIINEKSRALERSYLITVLATIIAGLLILLFMTFYRFYTIQKISARKLDREVKLQTEIIKKSYSDYDHLIYRTSHDVKGPVSTILGLIGLAKMEPVSNTIRDYLHKMESTSQGLSKMLSKLVLISNIQNQQPEEQEVNLRALTTEIFRSYSYLDYSPLIHTSFRSFGDESIVADPPMLKFIIQTLVENAFRYYNPSSIEKYISISLKSTASHHTISVEDSGHGIGEEYKGRIFQLFVVGTSNHGDGLGLFMAKRSAERMGGSITLTQNKNPTIFTVTLPRMTVTKVAWKNTNMYKDQMK